MYRVAVLALCLLQTTALLPTPPRLAVALRLRRALAATIVSPFDTSRGPVSSQPDHDDDDDNDDDELPLVSSPHRFHQSHLRQTAENVELVLDEMRPYLKADGGNVRLAEIDGPVVKLELEGACGTCPSSSMTMKMGLERKLKERIPEM